MLPALETLLERHREVVEVFEHKPPRELVAAKDIVRRDNLGRTVVACPAGQVPPHWLELTAAERAGLVEPPPPLPDGYMRPGPFGFSPVNVAVGRYGFVEEPS